MSEPIRKRIRSRADQLPDSVWDCEACGTTDSMEIRRSSLNAQFYADDISLKCGECRYVRVHGIPFESADTYERAEANRDGRVYDLAGDGYNPARTLAALGYTGKAESVETSE